MNFIYFDFPLRIKQFEIEEYIPSTLHLPDFSRLSINYQQLIDALSKSSIPDGFLIPLKDMILFMHFKAQQMWIISKKEVFLWKWQTSD